MTPAAPRTLGWLAVGATLALGLALTLFRAGSGAPLSMSAAALLGFFAVFAGAGLVAAVGLRRDRPNVIVAAAVALICLAPLSMGGATLPFLIPAVILLYVAGKLPPSAHGVPAWLKVATALVTICLLVAARIALFSTTEVVCWENLGGGRIVTTVLPNMPNEVTSSAPFGSGCSGGEIFTLGGSLAVLAMVGAVTIAAGSGRRLHSLPIVASSGGSAP